MDNIFLVYDVSYYKGVNRCVTTPCTTMEIAKRVLKDKLDWYVKNTILNRVVNNLGNDDIWEVNEYSVKINTQHEGLQIDLYIERGCIINK